MLARPGVRTTGALLRRPSPRPSSAQLALATRSRAQRSAAVAAPAAVQPIPQLEGGPTKPALLREQRAAARARRHLPARRAARSGPLSFLEVNSVTEGTAAQYSDEVEKFRAWARNHGVPTDTPRSFDGALCEYLEDLYFQGYNHDRGDKLVAALGYLLPSTRKHGSWHPTRALQALKGFRRLAPGLARAPLPDNGRMCIIGVAV